MAFPAKWMEDEEEDDLGLIRILGEEERILDFDLKEIEVAAGAVAIF